MCLPFCQEGFLRWTHISTTFERKLARTLFHSSGQRIFLHQIFTSCGYTLLIPMALASFLRDPPHFSPNGRKASSGRIGSFGKGFDYYGTDIHLSRTRHDLRALRGPGVKGRAKHLRRDERESFVCEKHACKQNK